MATPLIPARVRDYAYPIVTAGVPLLAAYGLISEQQVPLWVALGAALLGTATATAYRPSRTIPDGDGAHRADE